MRTLTLLLLAAALTACGRRDEPPVNDPGVFSWEYVVATSVDQHGVVCYRSLGGGTLSCVKVRP